jgi:NADPH:quinone reductase-like Zn-dependent oxidoreductase
MRAVKLSKPGGLEKLKVHDVEPEGLEADQIMVRVKASSLNYHDYLVAMGMIPADDGRIPMSDGAGEVLEVGSKVGDFQAGDHVVSLFCPNWQKGEPEPFNLSGIPGDNKDGFAAEVVIEPASAFTKIPQGFSFSEAATLPCAALTAWRALMSKARIKPGDWVLTQGTGGVSIFALQFAKAAGARVIATSSSAEKLSKLTELGADYVINYKDDLKWSKKAKEITGGRGVDEVVEIGGAGTFEQSLRACRLGGHISLIGVLAGFSGEVSIAQMFSQNIAIDGITVGSKQEQEDMIRSIEANQIRPVISDSFPLEGIADAFSHQAAQKHFGKIVLEF